MTVLRTTRSAFRRGSRRAGQGLALALGVAGILFGILGCGRDNVADNTDPQDPAAITETDRPLMTQLPAPRSEWIAYSANDRKLTLYSLPASGRWMVKRSDLPAAYPVGSEHTLPEGINPAETMVYYIRPTGQTSRGVTLAEIQAARQEHVSLLHR
jgi:hypothetical protein